MSIFFKRKFIRKNIKNHEKYWLCTISVFIKNNCMKKLFLILLLCIFTCIGFSQDREYAKNIVEKLSSDNMYGRGYVKNGCNKAAKYLGKEMKSIGLKSFDKNYAQKYTFNVNSFPGKMDITVDGKRLKSGIDYIIHPGCIGQKKTYKLLFVPDTVTMVKSIYQVVDTSRLENTMVVLPVSMQKHIIRQIAGLHNVIFLSNKIYWFVSHSEDSHEDCVLEMRSDALSKSSKIIEVAYNNKFLKDFEAKNVVGYVQGAVKPDSSIVFTAHYDHLGCMGKHTIFNGASDNATGTAFVLSLAKYYAMHPEKAYYTMIFVLLSGEEVGIYGSTYNASHPQWNLGSTRLLINFDMVGTGSEGITMVNSTIFPKKTQLLKNINDKNNLIPEIKDRGASCNSDHCPYYKKGVPAFFIYTRGKENTEYHTVTDTAEKIQFTIFEGLLDLTTSYVDQVKSPIFNRIK